VGLEGTGARTGTRTGASASDIVHPKAQRAGDAALLQQGLQQQAFFQSARPRH